MASQGAVKRTGKDTKNSGGNRAKKPRSWDYTRYRLSINDPNEFKAYYDGYPDKSGLMAYVYRLVPRIDLSLIGLKISNIHETANPEEMIPSFIENKFGRGRYMLKLTDANRPQGQREVAKTFFRLEDSEKPPVYDLRTLLLAHPDNQDEINRLIELGHLIRDPASGAPRLRTAADGDGPTPQAAHASNGAASGDSIFDRKMLGEIMVTMLQRSQQSPGDMMKQTLEAARMMQPQSSSLTPEQIADIVAARLQPADPFAAYQRVQGFIDAVRGPSGAAGAAPAVVASDVPWYAHVSGILTGLNGLLDRVPTLIDRLRAPRPAAAPETGATAVGPAGQINIIDEVAKVAKIAFEKVQLGMTGFDFAAWMCNWYPNGLQLFLFLEPKGPVGMMSLLAMHPETVAIVSDQAMRPMIENFLSDFFSFDPHGGHSETSAPVAEASAAA
jgi:hypothetical protein